MISGIFDTTRLCRPVLVPSFYAFLVLNSTESWQKKSDPHHQEARAMPNVKKTGQNVVSSDLWADGKIWARDRDDECFAHPKAAFKMPLRGTFNLLFSSAAALLAQC